MSTAPVSVAGVGMTPFVVPKASPEYDVLAVASIRAALEDAGLQAADVGRVYAGYVYGESTCGERVAYAAGLWGVPIVNVNNNCATGSTALWLAQEAVKNGSCGCALAVGFEKMPPGSLQTVYQDRAHPLESFVGRMAMLQEAAPDVPRAVQMFGGAGLEYQRRHGAHDATFAAIAVKARRHAAQNPKAVFRELLDVTTVLNSPRLYGPLTRLQCCPPTCGAAAALLVSPDFARRHGLGKAVRIRGQALTTDTPASFSDGMTGLVGYDMSRRGAAAALEQAAVDVGDVDVVELHDCFTSNELLSYEALGLAREGEAERMVVDGDNTYGGRFVVNPSGGLLAKGHPLGATGLAQCYELVTQLRGAAGVRQVPGARLALQHNIGLGGACVVTVYEAP